ncbi:MAG TPA: glycosyltransferase, partial [Anaerolineales bacterium]
NAGYPVTLIAGAGNRAALPDGVEFIQIPEMDSRNPRVVQASKQLESGTVPQDLEALSNNLESSLENALHSMDRVIVHNVFTKHFNLPLTAALVHLLNQGKLRNCIAWCHDITWTSTHSRSKVHPGYPWDLLRTSREDVTYVAVSRLRQAELAGLFKIPAERIRVIYNGVDPTELYGLSPEGRALIKRLDLNQADLILLMPVRITQAKNIELALGVVANLKGRGMRVKLVVTGPPDPHDPGNMEYYHSLLRERQRLNVVKEARFVYESRPQAGEGYTIGLPIVRELFHACDVLFLPSRREGFGMPILEASLVGMPVFTTHIPAAEEIGGQDVMRFSPEAKVEEVTELMLNWLHSSPTQRLKQRVRQNFTWQAIFRHDILPLLTGKEGP